MREIQEIMDRIQLLAIDMELLAKYGKLNDDLAYEIENVCWEFIRSKNRLKEMTQMVGV